MRLRIRLWKFEIHDHVMASTNDFTKLEVLSKKNIHFDNISVNKILILQQLFLIRSLYKQKIFKSLFSEQCRHTQNLNFVRSAHFIKTAILGASGCISRLSRCLGLRSLFYSSNSMNSTHSPHLILKTILINPTHREHSLLNILCIICSMLSSTQSRLRTLEIENHHSSPLILQISKPGIRKAQ